MHRCCFVLCALIVCAGVALATSPPHHTLELDRAQWAKFKSEFGKKYSSAAEESHRFGVFQSTLRKIERHNSDPTVSWRMGINRMADLTPAEFARLRTPMPDVGTPDRTGVERQLDARELPPTRIDWRAHNAVTPVENQGQCGSPYVWSVVGSIEGLYAIATGKLTQFSAGQLLDCTTPYGNAGCNGGLPSNTFTYLYNHTLANATACPYTPYSGKCHCNQYNGAVSLKYYVTLPAGDEVSMMRANGLIGPLSVTVNANENWQYYSSGIMTASAGDCPIDQLNHCVTGVGYGSQNGTDFWILKNSWGTDWGENGFMQLARGSNVCGVAELTQFPILDIIY